MADGYTRAEEQELRDAFDKLGIAGTFGKMVLVAAVRRLLDTLDAERAKQAALESELAAAGREVERVTAERDGAREMWVACMSMPEGHSTWSPLYETRDEAQQYVDGWRHREWGTVMRCWVKRDEARAELAKRERERERGG